MPRREGAMKNMLVAASFVLVMATSAKAARDRANYRLITGGDQRIRV